MSRSPILRTLAVAASATLLVTALAVPVAAGEKVCMSESINGEEVEGDVNVAAGAWCTLYALTVTGDVRAEKDAVVDVLP